MGIAETILCVVLLGGCVGQPGVGGGGDAQRGAGGNAGGVIRGLPPWGGSGPLPSGTTWQSDGPIEQLAGSGLEQAELAVPEEATPDMLFEAAGESARPRITPKWSLFRPLWVCPCGFSAYSALFSLTNAVGREGKEPTLPAVPSTTGLSVWFGVHTIW